MESSHHHRHARRAKWTFWGVGLGSLAWLLLRSGTNPKRLAYPCQRVALANSAGFLGYLVSVLGLGHFYHHLRRRGASLTGVGLFVMALALLFALTTANLPLTPVYAELTLPAWTSASAVSNVFAVSGVPAPECSLDGGALPATPPCNDAAYALRDAGMDSLVAEMEARGDYFYRTAEHAAGIVAANDVVVIKINNQWANNGTPQGRLSTNSDALKGLIWRILQHPNTFTGEVVVVENTQGVVGDWDVTPANAQDTGQSYQDVINAFQGLGYPVSLFRWDDLNGSRVAGGNVGDAGYPVGEYANGNNDNAYIMLEDSAGSATNELSYPKFQTARGTRISMRYGVWSGSAYDSGRLTLINMPVLKQHGMAGATIAWKNFIGFVTVGDNTARFGGWDEMHGYFWGYQELGDTTYGLLGRQLALIRAPDLNVVDAIWVANDNYDGTATRQDILLASTDPFAVDWYASEYVLYTLYHNQDASAARNGTFRSATRVNQNSAAAVWPSATYPYMDLLDAYNEDTPGAGEHDQMNVYVVNGGTACVSVTGTTISGPAAGYTGTLYTFNAAIAPANASLPITFTWAPEPDSGQATDTAQYSWAVSGTQTVAVTVANCGGSANTTHDITIAQRPTTSYRLYLPLVLRNFGVAPVCATPLTGVTIGGPASGYTGTLYTFSAAPNPAGATAPIAYTWTPAPQSGQGTASVTYQWGETGNQTIAVNASHCSGDYSAGADHVIAIQAIPAGNLVQPGDLTYVGAFRLPDGGERPLTFEYGGNAMTFNPDGHITNSDTFSGSLFVMGHNRLAWGELPDGNQVAEISIPVPVNSSNLEDLPYAEFLQNFGNVAAGHFTSLEEIPRVGMAYLNHPDTGPKIHLGWGQHMPPESPPPTHGWFDPHLVAPNFQGEWYIGTQDFNSVNGYMFEIPAAWAAAHAESRYLATGRYRDGGWGGMGPSLFAYTPWLAGGAAPVSGTHLAETVLLRYASSDNTPDIEHALTHYQHPDEWEGGAWLTTASGKSAVLFAGTKGTGAKYWYGWVNPAGAEYPCIEVALVDQFTTCRYDNGAPCPESDLTGCAGHNDARGWWSARFDAQMILYAPASLAQVAAGTAQSWDPQPYAVVDIDDRLYLNPPESEMDALGRGDQRRMRIGDVAYDRANGVLYVIELYADGAKPVVHVWQVQ